MAYGKTMYANSASKNTSDYLYYTSNQGDFSLYQGDCREVLQRLEPESVDLIFADPPYFLSNGGVTCKSGKMVSVHKGMWDVSKGAEENHEFNMS